MVERIRQTSWEPCDPRNGMVVTSMGFCFASYAPDLRWQKSPSMSVFSLMKAIGKDLFLKNNFSTPAKHCRRNCGPTCPHRQRLSGELVRSPGQAWGGPGPPAGVKAGKAREGARTSPPFPLGGNEAHSVSGSLFWFHDLLLYCEEAR